MDFIDEIRTLIARIPKQLEHLHTEEATKNALIMPFINALGYNVFDPTEVVPEFIADVGVKRGEKVDYAIMRDGQPVILIECKAATSSLDDEDASQLYRYFSATHARFGILTNGVVYKFHSDLDERNKMDLRPFLEVNMLAFDESLIEELKRFSKSSFDVHNTLEAAVVLKYTREIKKILAQQLRDPSEDFVRLVVSQIYAGRITQSVRDRFGQLTKDTFSQFINERVFDRLKSAMSTDSETSTEPRPAPASTPALEQSTSAQDDKDVVTTEEELQGFYIVKSLLHEVVDPKRVVVRDMKGFCGVLLDDTLRKPICRLRFNGPQKYLGLIDSEKHEHRVSIDNLDDIYRYAARLKETVGYYYQAPTSENPRESSS